MQRANFFVTTAHLLLRLLIVFLYTMAVAGSLFFLGSAPPSDPILSTLFLVSIFIGFFVISNCPLNYVLLPKQKVLLFSWLDRKTIIHRNDPLLIHS